MKTKNKRRKTPGIRGMERQVRKAIKNRKEDVLDVKLKEHPLMVIAGAILLLIVVILVGKKRLTSMEEI